tara:strand:- start:2923 stop:3234 length:312 start_codon:yes stop_codon:yes gene_type:complete
MKSNNYLIGLMIATMVYIPITIYTGLKNNSTTEVIKTEVLLLKAENQRLKASTALMRLAATEAIYDVKLGVMTSKCAPCLTQDYMDNLTRIAIQKVEREYQRP